MILHDWVCNTLIRVVFYLRGWRLRYLFFLFDFSMVMVDLFYPFLLGIRVSIIRNIMAKPFLGFLIYLSISGLFVSSLLLLERGSIWMEPLLGFRFIFNSLVVISTWIWWLHVLWQILVIWYVGFVRVVIIIVGLIFGSGDKSFACLGFVTPWVSWMAAWICDRSGLGGLVSY